MFARSAAALAVALAFGIAPAGAHEGHDHGAARPAASVATAPAGARAEVVGTAFELVAVAEGAELVDAPIEYLVQVTHQLACRPAAKRG